MKNNIARFIVIFAIAIFTYSSVLAQSEVSGEFKCPWNLEELTKTPSFEVVSEGDGVVGVIYKSVDYRGHCKDVFAYYSTPGILAGDKTKDKNLPAVVCVHGGKGKAFDVWVKKWAERGYAAISMDLRGYGKDRVLLPNGFQEGPEQITPNFVANEDQSEDWFYQAVSDVVLAHSLIRSFSEVDTTKIAITGISWGGIITTLVTGLDDRFKASVPVYGCGYLYEEGSMAPRIADNTELAQKRWYNEYDPALYVKNAKIPMLFIDGTNDKHFYVRQWTKTTDLVADKRYSMRLRMVHGHYEGWAPKEIYTFIDNVLEVNEYTPIPEFPKLKIKNNKLSCKVLNVKEGDKVSIIYTNETELDYESEWNKEYVILKGNKLSFEVNKNCHSCYISVETANSEHFSSKILFF